MKSGTCAVGRVPFVTWRGNEKGKQGLHQNLRQGLLKCSVSLCTNIPMVSERDYYDVSVAYELEMR